MKRIQIILSKCRRCQKPLATASRSIWACDALKEKYQLICGACLTEAEQREIDSTIETKIRDKYAK